MFRVIDASGLRTDCLFSFGFKVIALWLTASGVVCVPLFWFVGFGFCLLLT